MQIPLIRNLTLTATRIQLFDDNPSRRSYVIQNTGAVNSLSVSFDGSTDAITIFPQQTLTSGDDGTGGADYKNKIFVSSAAGTTMQATEVSI